MYSFIIENKLLSIIWKDRIFLKNIYPMLYVDGVTEPISLELKDECTKINGTNGEIDSGHFEYTAESEEISLSLDFEICGNIMKLRVSSQCAKSRFPFAKGYFFKPDCAVRINIESAGDIDGLVGSHRYSEYWTRPYYGEQISDMPYDTQALLWKGFNEYYYMLPVCDDEYKSILSGNKQGMDMVLFTGASGYDKCDTLACVFGVDTDPFSLSYKVSEAGIKNTNTPGRLRTDRRYPELFEYLGWCSWDAFQLWVNTEGVLDKAQEFRDKNLPVKWFIIDDMWAEVKNNDDLETTHDTALWSFEADPGRFPGGLETLVEKLKEDYGIKTGVWHPITGYWTGIDPEGPIAQKYPHFLHTTPGGRLLPSLDIQSGFMLWNAWHSLLHKQGVEFVKVDNQSFIRGFYKNGISICKIAKQMHEALEASTGVNFDNNLINCMGMASENMWHRPLSAISRSSGDFLPDHPQSFSSHALQNSFNSYVYGPFIWCDWDMWWSYDTQGVKSSVLRAVSGGPVYLSDKLGKTKAENVWPIILSSGRIIRCDRPGLPTADCLVKDSRINGIPLKIWNTCKGAGIVAAFNVSTEGKPVKGELTIQNVPYLKGDRFILYEYFSRTARCIDKNDKIEFALNTDDAVLFIVIPMNNDFVPIGLVDKYVSPGTIKYSSHNPCSNVVVLEEGGHFGFYSNKMPEKIFVNGEETAWEFVNGLYLVDCQYYRQEVIIKVLER